MEISFPHPLPPNAPVRRQTVRPVFAGTDRFEKDPPTPPTHAPLALFQLMLKDDAVADDFTDLVQSLLAHESTVNFMLKSLDRSVSPGPSQDRLLAFTRETLSDPRTAMLLENHLRQSLDSEPTLDLLIAGLQSLLKHRDTRQSLLNTLKNTLGNPETAAIYRQGFEMAFGRGLRAKLAMKSLEISAQNPFAGGMLLNTLQSALGTSLFRNTLSAVLKNPDLAPLALEALDTGLRREDTTEILMRGLQQVLSDPASRHKLRILLAGLLRTEGLAIRILEEIQALRVTAACEC